MGLCLAEVQVASTGACADVFGITHFYVLFSINNAQEPSYKATHHSCTRKGGKIWQL